MDKSKVAHFFLAHTVLQMAENIWLCGEMMFCSQKHQLNT